MDPSTYLVPLKPLAQLIDQGSSNLCSVGSIIDGMQEKCEPLWSDFQPDGVNPVVSSSLINNYNKTPIQSLKNDPKHGPLFSLMYDNLKQVVFFFTGIISFAQNNPIYLPTAFLEYYLDNTGLLTKTVSQMQDDFPIDFIAEKFDSPAAAAQFYNNMFYATKGWGTTSTIAPTNYCDILIPLIKAAGVTPSTNCETCHAQKADPKNYCPTGFFGV